MKNNISGLLFIIFIIVTTAVCVLGLTKQFHVGETEKTWQEARNYCRTHHTDLATIRTQEDYDHLISTLSTSFSYGWIGLQRDTVDHELWRWTEPNRTTLLTSSDNSKWFKPFNTHNKNCTGVYNKYWFSRACALPTYFHCNDANNTFQLVKQSMTWDDARLYCEENHQGLATVTENNTMLLADPDYIVWIGLFRDVDDVWKWAGENQSDFRNWGYEQPNNRDCGGVKFATSSSPYQLRWFSYPCEYTRYPLCFEEKLILVKENKTWEEALEFCRSLAVDLTVDPTAYNNHLYDLASLSDNDHVYANEKIQAATTDQVWTGLRFLAGRWLWVNGDQLQYQDLPLCPAQWQHCGTLPKDGATPWEVRDCQERRNFFCLKRGLA